MDKKRHKPHYHDRYSEDGDKNIKKKLKRKYDEKFQELDLDNEDEIVSKVKMFLK